MTKTTNIITPSVATGHRHPEGVLIAEIVGIVGVVVGGDGRKTKRRLRIGAGGAGAGAGAGAEVEAEDEVIVEEGATAEVEVRVEARIGVT